MDLLTQAEETGVRIRPEVRRHYPYFLGCVHKFGSEVVKQVLDKGHHEKYRLTFMKNKKDRYQMMQLLDLV